MGSFLFDHNPLVFFVEPRDSLHITIDAGYFGPSYSFSGANADNSRFIAEWIPRFLHFHLEYEDLEVEDFKRQVDERRREQLEFLAEGRGKYSLSPGFVDYATAYFNYGWARSMIPYPTNFYFANGHKNRDIAPEYYDFLQEIPLVDEKAIKADSYHTFLVRTLDWELQNSESRKLPLLSELRDLSALNLPEEIQGRLDSLYEKSDWYPMLSKMVDLSAAGLAAAAQARLDSQYQKKRSLRLSQMFDLPALACLKPPRQSSTLSSKRREDLTASLLQVRKRLPGSIRRAESWFSSCRKKKGWTMMNSLSLSARRRNYPKGSICQSSDCHRRPWLSSIPSTNIANPSSFPKKSISQVLACRRLT